MGLCKCPKRRVTNQFCFEHRVNVCEHCMVTNHPKCIVQSYLQWLQDSDYNPICELCTKELANEDCIRLVCYHVYHWSCLDQLARELPPTTAPAGIVCPSCRVGVFPAGNLVSPVADVLREKLAGVNWARAGLGLPLLTEVQEAKGGSGEGRRLVTEGGDRQATPKRPPPSAPHNHNHQHHHDDDGGPHSIVHVGDAVSVAFSRSDSLQAAGQVPRRVFQALDESRDVTFDHDENKYKRRSALEWFSRWWKSMAGPSPRGGVVGGRLQRRYCMAAVLVAIFLLTALVVLSWLGRMAAEDDPSLDPMQNPHVRVGAGAGAGKQPQVGEQLA